MTVFLQIGCSPNSNNYHHLRHGTPRKAWMTNPLKNCCETDSPGSLTTCELWDDAPSRTWFRNHISTPWVTGMNSAYNWLGICYTPAK